MVWQMTPKMQQWQRKRKEVSELTQQRQGTKVIRTCDKLLRMIGRAAVLGEKETRVAMGLALSGTLGFYARATAIGWEACEEIERTRRQVLRQRGFASGD